MLQIIFEIQKRLVYCGPSLQSVIPSQLLLVLSHPVRLIITSQVTPKQNTNYFNTDWIGDLESETGGRIGLWKICERNDMRDICIGKLEDVLELPTMSSQLAIIFAGTAVVTSLLTILCLVFMIFLKSTTVFHLCGWMQILSGKLKILFIFTFASNWLLQATYDLLKDYKADLQS